MEPCVLYRKSQIEPEDLKAAQDHFTCYDSMVGISDKLVIGRYSVLPFYDEVEKGLALQGSRLINSHAQHLYISEFQYYTHISHLTPKTYFRLVDVPVSGGPYIVKGVTNSKKHEWNTKMYAATKADAIRVACELSSDTWYGMQDIIVREYVPLEKLGEGLNGLPFSNEWRCFFYKRRMLSVGFYWSECENKPANIPFEAIMVAQEAADIASQHTNFFVVDVAKTAEGNWIVIELNCAQMSGLSDNNPNFLYENLARALPQLKPVEFCRSNSPRPVGSPNHMKFMCSLEAGHEPPHKAFGGPTEVLDTW